MRDSNRLFVVLPFVLPFTFAIEKSCRSIVGADGWSIIVHLKKIGRYWSVRVGDVIASRVQRTRSCMMPGLPSFF